MTKAETAGKGGGELDVPKKPELSKKEWKECDEQQWQTEQLAEELDTAMDLDIGEKKVQEKIEKAAPLLEVSLKGALRGLEALSTTHQATSKDQQATFWEQTGKSGYISRRKSLIALAGQLGRLSFWGDPSAAKAEIEIFRDTVISTIQPTGDFPGGHAAIRSLIDAGDELVQFLKDEMFQLVKKEFDEQQQVYDRRVAIVQAGGRLPRSYLLILNDLHEVVRAVEGKDFWRNQKFLQTPGSSISQAAGKIRGIINGFVPEPGKPVGTISKDQLKPLLEKVRDLSDVMRSQLDEYSENTVGRISAIRRWTFGKISKCLETKTGKIGAAILATSILVVGVVGPKVYPYFKGGNAPPAPRAPADPGADVPGPGPPDTSEPPQRGQIE